MPNRPLDYCSSQSERNRAPYRNAHSFACFLALISFWGNVVVYAIEHGMPLPLRDKFFIQFSMLRVPWAAIAIAGIYYGESATHFKDRRRAIGIFAVVTNACLLILMAIWLLWPYLGF